MNETNDSGIAIVGMSCRVPGARNIDEFWRNLRDGVESISFFTDEELADAGVDFPKDDPRYVKARGVVEGADRFDAAFFGINPKEAEITDPQHRVFLECAWEALENAGCNPAAFPGLIGVFAGTGLNSYFASNLRSRPELLKLVGTYQVMLANEKDYLPTRVSYKLNLRGPSLSIQTACSTSLVATCVACQNLLHYQCDVALAGGVCLVFPQKQGYTHQEGAIFSPDGHCRTFDAKAGGTVLSDGVGIVVLKRLEDAVADGDQIYAVIKGFAVNNDGASKVGFAAPSVEGQAEVISMAHAMAGVDPATIGYVETHGTATPIGDPIEVAALTKAFRAGTSANGFCAIGSVKTNVGHLDAAAGVIGLIKTCLALQHELLPPSLNFKTPNPHIDFANSPFHVNASLREWNRSATPRRASVSSFGIGGTNAHLVLEEAPAPAPAAKARVVQLLVLSARSEPALEAATDNLAKHLEAHPELDLADAAYTLQAGRRAFGHRRALACRNVADATVALRSRDRSLLTSRMPARDNPPVVFMFPGQGAQHVNMGRELYETEPAFSREVDACVELLAPHLGLDLRTLLYPDAGEADAARQQLTQTRLTQPALFVVEYALAKLWMRWGVTPKAMIGHSLGEYVAACLAGVFSLEDGLRLVAARGRLMQEQPDGAMLAVRLAEDEVRSLLDDSLSLAAINAPARCVVSGPHAAVNTLRGELARREVVCRLLETSHAFHSTMMEPVRQPFIEVLKRIRLCAPRIPIVSNVTGRWITAAEATDPTYWADHLRQTVRFADGMATLLGELAQVLLEVGPGQTCAALARQHPARQASQAVIPSFTQEPRDDQGELTSVMSALGRLWLEGVALDWQGFHAGSSRRRVPLPTYPFERKRFWVEPGARTSQDRAAVTATVVTELVEDRVAVPPTSENAAETVAPADRKTRLRSQLGRLLGELCGRAFTEADFNTSFVELGFDSLLLTQASEVIEKQFGVHVHFRQLLTEVPTLERLAAHLDASLPATGQAEAACESPLARNTGLQPASGLEQPQSRLQVGAPPGVNEALRLAADAPQRSDPRLSKEPVIAAGKERIVTVPLTAAQKELWYASQLGADLSCAFNQSMAISLRGPLQCDALRDAITQLFTRHEALRTTISPDGETQRIHAPACVELPSVDLSALDAGEREVRINTLYEEEAGQPFELANGPLARVRLARLDAQHHFLFFTAHHIVCDGRSLGTVAEELGVLYSAASEGVRCSLPPPMQLSAYASQTNGPSQGADEQAAERYWLQLLADPPAPLELPADHPRPAAVSLRGARETMTIRRELFHDLRRMSAQRGGTLFATLLAAYELLLHRLSGQEDFVIGIPAADRAAAGSDRLVGHCVNFLPRRARLSANTHAGEFLTGVHRSFWEAFEHRQCSFGRLIQKLNLPRNGGRAPLVSVTFNMGRMKNRPTFSGLDTELRLNPRSFVSFDLSLSITETKDGLELDCAYAADLFDQRTIQRWLGHYQTVLEAFAGNLEQSVAEVPLLTPDERQELLFSWNDTQPPPATRCCIHELFQAQARKTPDLVAMTFNGGHLTYGELNERADRLARHLQSLGLGPDVPAGIYMKRSPEMLIGVLAVLKSGGAYAPLDLAYPTERLRLMIDNARIPLVLTHESLRAGNPLANANCRMVYAEEPCPEAADGQPLSSAVTPDNLAYLIHTSGSTGTPKGVAMEHSPAVSLISWQIQNPILPPGTRTLQFTSLSFDVSFQEIFSTWCAGGTLVLIDEQLQRDAARLIRFIDQQKIARLFLPFVALQELAEVARELDFAPGSLREVFTAGEQLQITPAIGRLFSRLKHCRLYNQYGPTESHVVVTSHLLTGNPAAWPPLPPIGKPLAQARIYLLDAHRQPVPIGVAGELYIAGESLARGYLHRPDLTAERFLPDPFRNVPGARMYRTGDLARWTPAGSIEYVGRIDHQVKIRGYRVELGEVEQALGSHPAVRECVVTAREDSPGGKRLVAYVVPRGDALSARNGELRRFLLERLPEYMAPASFVCLEALPVTQSGKVNRRALPPPDEDDLARPTTSSPPRTETEAALSQIWRDVLGLRCVGVEDNFFELGGHSLLATRVLARVTEAFQVEVPMRCLFEAPTIAALAGTIEQMLVAEIDELSEEEAEQFARSVT